MTISRKKKQIKDYITPHFQNRKFLLPILCLLLFAFSSCLPDNNNNRTNRSSPAEGPTPAPPDEPPIDTDLPDVFWFLEGQIVKTMALVNANSPNVIYLRGSEIHRYLADTYVPHCIVLNYQARGEKRQLRSRAIPINFSFPQQNRVERIFRLDLASEADNKSLCSGEASWIDQNNIVQESLFENHVGFKPEALCPECSGSISSISMQLYKKKVGPSELIPQSELRLSGLGLRIDFSNTSGSPTGSCSEINCGARGFDCCIEGQCVNDGSLRPGIDNQSEAFLQALSEIQDDPMAFVNYPEFFNICINKPPPGGNDQDDGNAQEEAEERLRKRISEYLCLEEGKKDNPDFQIGTCSNSNFETRQSCQMANHKWYFHCRVGRCSDLDYPSRADCLNAGETWESYYAEGQNLENGGFDAFFIIRGNIWRGCGCKADPFPTDPEDPHCPDFGLKAVKNQAGKITDVVCKFPPPDLGPSPFQNLTVQLSSRTAPHRFYREDGQSVDDISALYNTSIRQEGEEFYYLDEASKNTPIETNFSMNAVLGQMSVQLNRALPAKTIHLDYGQAYILSATQGVYTPCPQCSRDSWFEAFTRFPQTQAGRGLQSIGYSTSRDQFRDNLTYGNYEDTVFGRACWLPPTMIPFSHRPQENLSKQRRDRLKTQAALFINGYQRDWWGFNLGALIGSFDGVQWFAIGSGRRVIAESNKLFLAINAPHADLADAGGINVSVIEDLGGNTVSNYDFSPNLSFNHPEQNQGATCRAYHQCEVDSDCITHLGWEYQCADVGQYQTRWPRFDLNANERVNSSKNITNLFNISLQGFPGDTSRRQCVYRGRGAICYRDTSQISNQNQRRALTCAPNFYCASIYSSSGFNKEISRSLGGPWSILFGQEADVVGRPKNYIGAPYNLDPDDILINLADNLSMMIPDPSQMGICLPGKSLNQNLIDQHTLRDQAQRTDYISQIGSCNSNANGIVRTQSCPALNSEGNLILPASGLNTDPLLLERSIQNMCGGEVKYESQAGDYQSAFRDFELAPLNTISSLLTPGLARDACLRRAGAVCHTDLDCGPNELHANSAFLQSPQFFGQTLAEKQFWEEGLICGQAKPAPSPVFQPGITYDMTKNRCCRPVGSTLTMHTEVSREGGQDVLSTDPRITEKQLENVKLRVDRTPATSHTFELGRYSRYLEIDSQNLRLPLVEISNQDGRPVTPAPNQWRTFLEAGKRTCCGGGWIRKFSDGTTDWFNRERLRLPPENFRCLNTPFTFEDQIPAGVSPSNYNFYLNRLCRSPGEGGCIQYNMDLVDTTEFRIHPPRAIAQTATMSTAPTSIEANSVVQPLSVYVPYMPRRFINILDTPNISTDQNYAYYDGFCEPTCLRHGFSIIMPAYIGLQNIVSSRIRYRDSRNTSNTVNAPIGNCPGVITNPAQDLGNNQACLETRNGFDILHVKANLSTLEDMRNVNGVQWAVAGIEITFDVFGSANASGHARNMLPGNPLYYTSKLARLELLGIPQIFYEPIYCSNDRDQLVDGIFNDFNNRAFPNDLAPLASIYGANANDNIANPGEFIVLQDGISLPKVFSDHEFKCCLELGTTTQDPSQCCSGFIHEGRCSLPSGTNLNVYFNKFVSSEGMSDSLASPLRIDDFVAATGEPKFNSTVATKLLGLGTEFCASEKVIRGGSSGNFYPKPNTGNFVHQGNVNDEDMRYLAIIDGPEDFDSELDSGYSLFQAGFRWRHHFYCE